MTMGSKRYDFTCLGDGLSKAAVSLVAATTGELSVIVIASGADGDGAWSLAGEAEPGFDAADGSDCGVVGVAAWSS
jgi:hypothetical protein